MEIDVLKGRTLVSVKNEGDMEIAFETAEGEKYVLHHHDD